MQPKPQEDTQSVLKPPLSAPLTLEPQPPHAAEQTPSYAAEREDHHSSPLPDLAIDTPAKDLSANDAPRIIGTPMKSAGLDSSSEDVPKDGQQIVAKTAKPSAHDFFAKFQFKRR